MKKQIIGALVGGIILFVWQFMTWAMLDLHGSYAMKYTPNQEAIMETLNENLTEDGTYLVLRTPMDATEEEAHKFMEDQTGKPWAQISYHKARANDMGMNMLRAVIIDIVSIFLLCWLLLQMKDLNFMKIVLSSLAVGFIGYFTINYLDTIWFKDSSIPYLIDTVVSWGLIGAWLGWWLPRD